jgi:hypothetical protein
MKNINHDFVLPNFDVIALMMKAVHTCDMILRSTNHSHRIQFAIYRLHYEQLPKYKLFVPDILPPTATLPPVFHMPE